VIRVFDEAGKVIETHEHKGEFKEWLGFLPSVSKLSATCACRSRG
jgi:hypothetical protein